jgi:hypothetical protein
MKRLALTVSAFALVLCSCKDATVAQWRSMGSRHKITMYGCDGKVIGSWTSTGNVSNEKNSDGWYFEDEQTHKLVEVTGALVIEQIN